MMSTRIPGIRLRGIRQSIPSGYVLGRASPGTGDTQLIPHEDLAAKLVSTGAVVGPTTQEWQAGTVTSTDTTEIVITTETLTLANRGAVTLMGNPGTAAAKPSDVSIGNGLTLSPTGTLSAEVDNRFAFNSGTIALASVGATTLFGNSSTASAEPAGTIAIGSGLSLSTTGTLSATAPPDTDLVTAVDSRFAVNSGTLALANTASGTLFGNSSTASAEPAGTIAIGAGVTLSAAGTLSSTGLGGTVTKVDTGTGLTGGPVTTTGTVSLATRTASTLMGNPGTVAATPSDIAIGSGLSLSTAGTLSSTGLGGTVTQVATSGAGISGGPITTAGTLTVEWNAGTVTALAPGGLVISGGTVDTSASNPSLGVQAATTGVLPNTPTYTNGTAGVGAKLTAGSTGTLTVDGQLIAAGDRVLVKDQASALENGIYVCTTAGAVGVAYVLTRAPNFNAPQNMNDTGMILCPNGTTNAITGWEMASGVTTVGTDAVVFTQFTRWQAGLVSVIGTGLSNSSGTLVSSGAALGTLVAGPATQSAAIMPVVYPPIVQPGTATFTTWINQNGATITDQTNGATVLSLASVGGAGNKATFRGVNVPGGNWTATVNATVFGWSKVSSGGMHLPILTDGTKLWGLEVQYENGPQLAVVRYTNNTTFASTDFFDTIVATNPFWGRIIYDSVTPRITFQYSVDGNTWITLFTTTTLFFTPTQIGIGIDNQGNAKGTAQGICLNYWHVG